MLFVNTRPAHQAETLNKLLANLGAKTINLPTLAIKPYNALQAKENCEQLNQFDIAIFVSANAAHCSHQYWPYPFPITTIIAVGSGTAKTLKHYGLVNIHLPKQFNSKGLLKLPELTNVNNKKIIIFCGKNSRPLLAESLSQRCAVVTLCECYQRICPKPKPETLVAIQAKKLTGIISTSKESLENLNLFLKDNVVIKKTPLIVISNDMKKLAERYGWQHIVIAPNASNEAIVETLRGLSNKNHPFL